MMMKAVSLAWAGTVEKIEQSGASVGVGQKIAGVVSSTVVVGGSRSSSTFKKDLKKNPDNLPKWSLENQNT